MERDRGLWQWLGSGLILMVAAFVAVAGGLAAAKKDYSLFTSAPMILAYIFGAGAFFCLIAVVRDLPFPFTPKPERQRNRGIPAPQANRRTGSSPLRDLDLSLRAMSIVTYIAVGLAYLSSVIVTFEASIRAGIALICAPIIAWLLYLAIKFVLKRTS